MVDFLLRSLAGDQLTVEVKSSRQAVRAYLAPPSLKDIAQATQVEPPTALAHLRRLEDEGRISKVQSEFGPRYAILPFLKIEWQDPASRTNLKWTSNYPVDWRFPLVSRVPDVAAQEFLLRWFDLLLTQEQLPALQPRQLKTNSQRGPRVDFVVYGSCARGDATPRSDIDLLVIGAITKRQGDHFVDAAHEASLGTNRSPDIRAMNLKDWQKAEPTLRANIQKEGLAVYSTDPSRSLIAEAPT